ncbi:MAG TPA: ABC transporter substrate-binding protein [Acetobacteraceae bacterium]|nr:ABC transporter substrate-binding protein [Acetobacteraceae bacterium]
MSKGENTNLLLPRRRDVLRGASALGAAALAAPFVHTRSARAADTVKIGLLLAKTGDIAAQTEYLANGTMLALEQRKNTVMGKPAELVWYDEPSPQGAQQNFQKLIQEAGVVAVLGGALSSSALAEEATAARLKVPFIIDNAAATDITGKNCNRYTFRLNTPVAVQAAMFAPFLLEKGKRWYFLTASYAFGQDIAKSFKELLTKAGGTIVGDDSVPLNTPDYSSFILKIRDAKPDMILGGVPAGDLSTFLKQWAEMGMKGKIPICEIAIGDTDIWSVGPEAATGLYTSLWWYKNPANPPEEQAFADAYLKKYGKPAADKAWMGWITAKSLFDSIDAAKSTEPDAIIAALESWQGGTADSPYSYRKGDHQMMLKNLVVQVKPKITDKWDYFDVIATVPKSAAELDQVFGSPAANGCTMS